MGGTAGWRARFERLLRTPRGAACAVLPAVAMVAGFAATITFTIPMVPVVVGLVAVAPRRWLSVALAAAAGSASAGALFIHCVGTWGSGYIAARLPQLAASPHWQHLVDWIDAYGLWALALYAVSPMPQLPGFVAFALFGLSGSEALIALGLGKSAKYLGSAAVAAGVLGWLRRVMQRFGSSAAGARSE
jgi:hypothetical protein